MGRVLAFDLGASSGRAVLAEWSGGKIALEEIHRFPNDPVTLHGGIYWDVLRLFHEIKQGILAAGRHGGFDSMGIDAWGVDFGLLDARGRLIGNPVHYRDPRTSGFRELYRRLPREELYRRTGIQEAHYNTIFQLDYLAGREPEQLERSDCLLFMPDLLNYFLTGERKCEYTAASTSGLLQIRTGGWDTEILERIGVPRRILRDIVQPGTICGPLLPELCGELGASPAAVVCVASHDTASAVAAAPAEGENFAYISSGTWSLLGMERAEACTSDAARLHNFANEGGAGGSICFLSNIMGTWLLQECRRQWKREGRDIGYGELDRLAMEAPPFRSFIDVDHPGFVLPGNMPETIRDYCRRTGQIVPEGMGETARCIYESLAMKYRRKLLALEECTALRPEPVHVMGGAAKSDPLCRMTADACGRRVVAGPEEAAVWGNICMQYIATGKIRDMAQARTLIRRSCPVKEYESRDAREWERQYEIYRKRMLQ